MTTIAAEKTMPFPELPTPREWWEKHRLFLGCVGLSLAGHVAFLKALEFLINNPPTL